MSSSKIMWNRMNEDSLQVSSMGDVRDRVGISLGGELYEKYKELYGEEPYISINKLYKLLVKMKRFDE